MDEPNLIYTKVIVVPRRDSLKSQSIKYKNHIKRQINGHLQGVGFFMRVIVDDKGKDIVDKYMGTILEWESR